MKDSILNKISGFTAKLTQLKWIQGISRGGMQVMPFIMVGSFASLFAGLQFASYQAFLTSSGLSSCLQWLTNCTTNIIGLLFMYFISKSYAKVLGIDDRNIGIMGISIYLMLCPSIVTDTGVGLSFDYLGAKGVIMAIVLALIIVQLYKYILSKDVKIKLPEGTPDYVSNSFSSILPFVLLALFALVVRFVFLFTPYKSIFDAFYAILQIPLTALVGANIFSQLILNIIAQSLWVFGIHGSSIIDTLRGPIMFGLDGAQQAAYAIGKPLPNIMGMAFSYMYYTAIMYPAVAIAVCCFAKSKRMKMVGKMALPASFFGISEPLVFGLPIVFNPILAIPFIFIPSITMGIAYLITYLGLVSAPIGVAVFNIPLAINGILNGSWTIAVLQIILLILSVIMWMPFIKFADKKALEEEKVGELKSDE